MDAISSDENGKANIDYDKCVSCGQCLVNCPFGAIADKLQIFRSCDPAIWHLLDIPPCMDEPDIPDSRL
jgi:Fe-S-cluster-containing hydrogenase component 2